MRLEREAAICKICVDFELGKLSLGEAYNNLREIWDENDEHSIEIWKKLIEHEKELFILRKGN